MIMLGLRLIKGTLVFLIGGCMTIQVLAATCYFLDGTNAGTSNALCNPNATGTASSHSACCNVDNGDVCLSTGLCLNTRSVQQSHLLWATGCTDRTFKDPSCPQYCQGLKIDNARLKNCNDTFFCCDSDAKSLTTQECCNQAFKLTQPIGDVVAQLQPGIGAIPLATGSPVITASPGASSMGNSTDASKALPSGAVAGIAVETVILVLSLAGLGYIFWRNRLLWKKLKEAEAATIAARGVQHQQQQYQWQPQPSSHSNVVPQMVSYGYGSPVDTELPRRSELSSLGSGAYPELPGTEIGTELSSEPRTPGSPYPKK